MDLDIENYNTDELCKILELNENIITPELLKNNLLIKIKLIETAEELKIENSKVDLITFYIIKYFKLINHIEKNKNNTLNDINLNLKNINDILINKNILNDNNKNNLVEQPPHYVIKSSSDKILNVFNKDIKSGIVNPLYRQVIKKYLNINSRFRDNYVFTKANNFSINFDSPINNILSMKIVNHDIPSVVHLISSTYKNNIFKIKRATDSSYIPIYIDNGSYDICGLLDEINSKLNHFLCNNDISILFRKENGKIIFISESKEHFDIDFMFNDVNSINNGINNKNSITNGQLTLGWILGFRGPFLMNNYNYLLNNLQNTNDCNVLEKINPTNSNLTTIYKNDFIYEGESLIDLYYNNYFLLSINDFMNNHNNSFSTPFKNCNLNYQNIIARLSSKNDNNCSTYIERVYFGPTIINKLEIKLYDEYGYLVDMNNSDFSFLLEINILYEN